MASIDYNADSAIQGDRSPENDIHRMRSAMSQLSQAALGPSSENVLDIPITIKVVLGRIKLSIGRILALQPGELLIIDRKKGQLVDLVIGDKIVGRGELVVCDGSPVQIGVTVANVSHEPDLT